MRVNKKEAAFLEKAIDEWEEKQVIDVVACQRLRKSIIPYKDDFDSFTFYAFVAAVSCALLAFGAIVLDEKWIERMRQFFSFSELVIGFIFGILSACFIWWAQQRKKKHPDANLSNESFHILIVLGIGITVTYIARGVGQGFHYYGLAILITAIIYGITALYLNSKLLWICMLLAIMGSWIVQTYNWSEDKYHSYWIGMNYPLRMTVLGGLFLLSTYSSIQFKKLENFYWSSYYFSWVFFLLSALILSISGNLSYEVWSAIRQGKLFPWALGYTVLLCLLVLYAYKLKNDTFRDIVILFFLLNIYIRYFEYFWDKTNKGIFFTILALSFWLLGRKAEQMRKKFKD